MRFFSTPGRIRGRAGVPPADLVPIDETQRGDHEQYSGEEVIQFSRRGGGYKVRNLRARDEGEQGRWDDLRFVRAIFLATPPCRLGDAFFLCRAEPVAVVLKQQSVSCANHPHRNGAAGGTARISNRCGCGSRHDLRIIDAN